MFSLQEKREFYIMNSRRHFVSPFYSWQDIWYSWVLHTFTLDDWLFRHMNSEIHSNILRFLGCCRVYVSCLLYIQRHTPSLTFNDDNDDIWLVIWYFLVKKASNKSICTHIPYKLFFSNMSFTFFLIHKQTICHFKEMVWIRRHFFRFYTLYIFIYFISYTTMINSCITQSYNCIIKKPR